MFRRLSAAALTLGLSLAPMSAQIDPGPGQEKEQEKLKHEVTVTANRIETPVGEAAGTVTVITRRDLERTGKITVLEALRDITGFSFTQNGPPGSSASAHIRGANAEHTKVLIDGMELNDPMTPGRTFDMGLLLVESIDRIEVARGPQSTLYGSDAMGGVIHIITGQERSAPRFHFSSLGGSYGTLTGNAGISGQNGMITYSLGAAYLNSRGFSAAGSRLEDNLEKDGYRNLTLSVKLGLQPHENIDLHFTLRAINSTLDIDNFGGDSGDDPNNVQDYDALVLGGGGRGLFARNRWETKLNLSVLRYDRRQENPTDALHPFDAEQSRFRSDLLKLDWQNNIFAHKSNTLTAGLEATREQGESEYSSEGQWGPFTSLFPRQAADTFGVYIQDHINFSGRFYGTLGVRYDHHSQAGAALTYRFAPGVFLAGTGTRLKFNLGTGFKAPSLYQLFAPATLFGPVGNTGLEPEKSTGWDLGIEQEFLKKRVTLGALYFSNSFRDLIDFDYLQGYKNIGRASTKGAEIFLRSLPVTGLSLEAGYTRLVARDISHDDILLRRPKHKFTVKLSYNLRQKGHITIDLIHMGTREDRHWVGIASQRVTLAAHTLVTASAAYNIQPCLQVFARLDNLLNQEYELVKGFGTPGLSGYGGVRFDF